MKKSSSKLILLTSVSAVTMAILAASPAKAVPPNVIILSTGAPSLTNGEHSSLSGTTVTTSDDETLGAYVTGNGSSSLYVWDVNGNLVPSVSDTSGFLVDTSKGTITANFNSVNVQGNDKAGITIITSGSATAVLNINGTSTILGDNSGATSAGIYVDSESNRAVTINVAASASVTNGSGEAGIHIEESLSVSPLLSTIDNSGTVSGGAEGQGIQLDTSAFLGSLTNQNTALITGGTSGDGVVIESKNGSNPGLTTFINYGVINGGSTLGDGLVVSNTGYVSTIDNRRSSAVISGGGGNSVGILLSGTGQVNTITNASSGVIKGGTGTAYGIEATDDSSITTLNNSATIKGADTAGSAIYVHSSATINTINNLSAGLISTSSTDAIGYGILVDGDAAGDTANISTITNRGTIRSGGGDAAIGLLGGDSAGDTTRVITSLITNNSAGVIQGRSGGDGIEVGNYHSVSTLRNYGKLTGNDTSASGVNVSGHGIITIINNGSSLHHSNAKITGSDTSNGGNGVNVEDSASIDTLTNWGTISANVAMDAALGVGINVDDSGTITTIENHGTIKGGTSTGSGIRATTSAQITTINNYSTGTITGQTGSITLANTGQSTTINTSGVINGGIKLARNTGGVGDIINIYGGSIDGDIIAADSVGSNNFGTVNFNLFGGSFGSGGASGSSHEFETEGDIGTSTRLNAVNINSGTLILNDDISANTTTVASGATLLVNSDASTIGRDFVNNGTLDLQTSAVTISRNISGSGTLAFTIEAGTGGDHGYISDISGTANLSSMTIAPDFNAGDVVYGQKLVLVNNSGTLSFNPLTILSTHGVKWQLTEAETSGTDYQGYSYSAGSLIATALGLTANVPNPNAGALDPLSSYEGSNTDILALQNALTNITDNNKAGAQLRPDANGGGVLSVLGVVEQTRNNILAQLNGDTKGNSGVSSGDAQEGISFWATAFGSNADQDTIAGVDGFTSDSYGTSFGIYKQPQENLRIGASFTYANSKVDDKGDRSGSGEEIDSYLTNIYGGYDFNPWYVDVILTGGAHRYDSTRLVDFTGPVVAKGSYSGLQYGAQTEVGYPVHINNYTITPLAGFAYDAVHQHGYTEIGAGGANLAVDGSKVTSYRSTLGVKTSAMYD